MPETTPTNTFPVENLWLNLGSTVVTVAIVVGIVIYIFAYFSGGKRNKAKINMCIISTVVINFLAMPFAIKIYQYLAVLLSPTVGFAVTVSLWIGFMAGISVNMYEIFVVTAKEAQAHPE